MYKHFIAISSVYSKGMRIAWHYTSDKYDPEVVQSFLNSVKKKVGEIQLGIHRISTESKDWNSVVESDNYFADIIVYTEQSTFISMISDDQELKALDVAKFILSIKPISHLKLQKLIYLSYEKFLKRTGVKLFTDDIFAWKHGPVIENVYDVFKTHGSEEIHSEEEEEVLIFSSDIKATASLAKVFASEYGLLAFNVIVETVQEHDDKTAWDLVNLTHVKGGPWDTVYKEGYNKLISDEIILSYS